jgi:hypothetical protein
MLLLFVLLGASAFGIAASVLFFWASGRSPLWNIGLALMIVLAGAAALLVAIVLAMRRLSP